MFTAGPPRGKPGRNLDPSRVYASRIFGAVLGLNPACRFLATDPTSPACLARRRLPSPWRWRPGRRLPHLRDRRRCFPREGPGYRAVPTSAAVMIAELLAVPLGGALMTWSSPWLPFVLGLVILTAGIPLAAFLLPEIFPAPSERNQSPSCFSTRRLGTAGHSHGPVSFSPSADSSHWPSTLS